MTALPETNRQVMQYNHGVPGAVGLIGRDDELDTADRFLDGTGRCALLIRGEAGLGKTALTDEIAHRASTRGWQVVRVAGVQAETSFALGALNQIVYSLRDDLAALGDGDCSVLTPVLDADPVAAPAPMKVTMALLALLFQAAQRVPLLMIAEDVHWFDDVSAAVLDASGRRLSTPRVRVLATARPTDGGHIPEGWQELELYPLSVENAERLVDQGAPGLRAATRQQILSVAAGNPLALQELPRSAGQMDTWAAGMPLTDRLVTVFGARLRQLDDRVRTELLRAALDGAPAATAAGSAARYTMVDVQTAVDGGLLTADPCGAVVFRHPLVGAAVIHQASAAQRRDAHAHLAQLYRDMLMRRATHLSAAAERPDQTVADLLDRAAHLSIRRGGAATAVDWLRRAAELSTDVSRREQLRADAAFVAAQASRFDDAQQLADDPAAEPGTATSVLTAAYLALYRDGDVLGGHRQILTALSRAPELDDATVERLVKLLLAVTMYCGEPALWQQTDIVVDQLMTRLGADTLIYRDAWGDVTRRGHGVPERLAVQLARLERREPWEVMRLGVAAYYVDRLGDITAPLRKLFRQESERGAITNAMTMLHLLLLDQIATGDWEQARASTQLGLELTTTNRNDLFHHQFIAYHGLHAAATGDTDTARRCAGVVAAWARPRRLGLLLGIVRRIATVMALGAGDYAAAHDVASQDHICGEIPPYSKQLTEELLDLVESAVQAGRPERAQAYVDLALGHRIRDISPRLAALTDAVAAMTTADEAEAGRLYELALAHPGLAGFPFERNRIRLSYGMWLRRRRRNAEAREQLTRAAEGFRALAAAPWEQRCTAELRASGVAVKRAPAHAVTLTSQERTIAELAAAGYSNKQIAAQLYLSPRTVGAHLYRIFPKLGVSSRAALGQAMSRLAPE